ncbi:MAG: hypothetical protein K2L96_04745 [Muribaculaceae bacterium]|nr:hypothetical protein [Muribaculaceae bacterium]
MGLKAILAPIGTGIALSLLSTACFTGVESTPRIDDSALKKAKAAELSAEDRYFASVVPAAASSWQPGKELIVTDSKIRLILTPDASGVLPDLHPGDRLEFRRFEEVRNIVGESVTDAVFSTNGFPELRYRMPWDEKTLTTTAVPEIPFTVDPSLAARADSILRNGDRRLYVLTPLWYDAGSEKSTGGYRLIAVEGDSIRPGNHIFPLKFYFHVADEELASTPTGEGEKMVYMSHGGRGIADSRGFGSLFSFTNPRKRYPQISPDIWTLIINSRVREGMTKDECRLALGSPTNIDLTPTRVGDLERWSYSDGIYLIFNTDGTLARYRL